MLELSIALLPFLIADVVNPVLFAFMVFTAGTPNPVISSSAVLLGHTFAYLISGVLLALGFERIAAYLANPSALDYFVGLVVGCLLLWVAIGPSRKKDKRQPESGGSLTPLKAFGLGAVINFVGVPFALPYFAALDQILKADLSFALSLAVLIGYNLLYALPFVIVPALVVAIGDRSRPVLERINGVLERVSGLLMPILLGLAGLALIADALLYFFTGQGLF